MRRPSFILLCLLSVVFVPGTSFAARPTLTRVSVAPDGSDPSGYSIGASISADGRFVAFASAAHNLVPNDTNGFDDIFVKDLTTGAITRVSVAADGTQGDGTSSDPSISGDGRYVAFASMADDFIPNDVNESPDIFVHDMQTGITALVSESSSGKHSNGPSGHPVISTDGSRIAFWSMAFNLVADDFDGEEDVFVRDLSSNTTVLESVGPQGETFGTDCGFYEDCPAISADGSHVAYIGYLPDYPSESLYVRDIDARATTDIRVSDPQNAFLLESPALSGDGNLVAFWSDAEDLGAQSGSPELFVHNLAQSSTVLAAPAVPGATDFVSPISSLSLNLNPSFSANGRFLAFFTAQGNLVPGDLNGVQDAFVRDLIAGTTTRVSVSSGGEEGDLWSMNPSISGDGSRVAFTSMATDFDPSRTTSVENVYLYDARSDHSCGGSTDEDGALSGMVRDRAESQALPTTGGVHALNCVVATNGL